jgi:hypothetical protein
MPTTPPTTPLEAAVLAGQAIKALIDFGVTEPGAATIAALNLTLAGGTDERRAILDALR